MKTAIFTWLFLLPLQIYASNINLSFSDEYSGLTSIHAKTVESIVAEDLQSMGVSELTVENNNFQAVAASLEKDIQKLKSQLAHKNHEINSQELSQWKAQSATLIFFIGMLFFAFLYIKSKYTSARPQLVTLSNLYSQEK